MIEEKFLQSAVNIRRTYLKVSNNLNLYHERAKDMIDTLNDTLKRVESLQEDVNNAKKGLSKNISEEEAMTELLKILKDIEDEGKKLERLTEPMNKEIERLAIEEQELYSQIKQNHPQLKDDDIIESVKNRLEKEGLS